MMLDAALAYAKNFGWHVMPLHTPSDGGCSCRDPACSKQGKHPRIKLGIGMEGASADPTVIRDWWRRWPDANIGIATGPSGIIVVDVDPAKGGAESLQTLATKFPELRDAPRQRTGSDGLHLILAAPKDGGEPIRNSQSALGPGVDVRGAGGLFVAAPSLHKCGERYVWAAHADPSMVPIREPTPALAAFIRQAKREARAQLSAGDGPLWVPVGKRHDTLVSLVGSLHAKGFCKEAILACMMEFNQRQVENPPSVDEVKEIVDRVTRYPRKGRGAA